MKIIAIGKSLPEATEEDFRPHLQEEAARAWELYASGVFRELYFRTDQPDAVLVLECADVEEARKALRAVSGQSPRRQSRDGQGA